MNTSTTILSIGQPDVTIMNFAESVHIVISTDTHEVRFIGPKYAYEQAKLRNCARKTRISVWGEDRVDFSDLPAGWQYSKDPVVVKACKAKNKVEIANQLAVIKEAQPLLEAVNHGELAEQKLKFSRYAGCSCGCSPGFIADRLIVVNIDGQRPFYTESISITRKPRG